jgi:hypothetical protein
VRPWRTGFDDGSNSKGNDDGVGGGYSRGGGGAYLWLGWPPGVLSGRSTEGNGGSSSRKCATPWCGLRSLL